MKYAVVSDLHANSEAFARVLADAAAQGAASVVCLGDIVGYGPSPAETLSAVRRNCRFVIAGNHDDAVAGRIDESGFIDLAGDAVSRHRAELDPAAVEYLASLPYECSFGEAVAAHGSIVSPRRFDYVESEDDAAAAFRAVRAPLVFTGHTHVPCVFLTGRSGAVYRIPPQDFTMEDGKRYIVNPGSAGYPRESDGKCLSSYVLYDDAARTVEFRFLPFSVASVMQKGRGRRKTAGRVFVCALALSALAAASVAWFVAAKRGGARTAEAVSAAVAAAEVNLAEASTMAVKRVPLSGANSVSPGIALSKKPKSPPVDLRMTFFSSSGEVLCSETHTVRESMKKFLKLPAAAKDAAEVELRVMKTGKDGSPSIASFEPSVK